MESSSCFRRFGQASEGIAAKLKTKSKNVFVEMQWDDPYAPAAKGRTEAWLSATDAQRKNWSRWFANLNTPEEFAEAKQHVDALDT